MIVLSETGIALDSDKFVWNQLNKTFSSKEDGIQIDLGYMNNVKIECGNDCTITAFGKGIVVICGNNCRINLNANEIVNVQSGNFCRITTKKRFHFIRKFFKFISNF